VAHVGKLYPVAFRRDMNLDQRDNRKYLPRCFACTFVGLLGSWGTKLNGNRFTDIHEATPQAGELERWIGGPYVHAGRTFSIRLVLQQGPTFTFELSGRVIDSVVGELQIQLASYDRRDSYRTFHLGGTGPPIPHADLYWARFATDGMDIAAVLWNEYNVLHP